MRSPTGSRANQPANPSHARQLPIATRFTALWHAIQWDVDDGHCDSPQALMFSDDGTIPNNPRLPFLVYRSAIDLSGTPDPEDVIERTFARHGWGDMWRNGIYPYVHYHSMIHEVLAVARGRARVQFGGPQGEELDLAARRRHGAARRHRPSVPVGGARADGDRRLSEERQIRSLPRQQGRARRARSRPSPTCRCPTPTPSTVQMVRSSRCGVERRTRQVMSDWRSFWDSEHSIYVNARHKDVHYREIAEQIAAFVPSPAARVLDYGSGDAIHADRVAAVAAEVMLCDAAPSVRAAMAARFAGNPRIKVISPEEVAALPDGRLDLIVTNSVAQYLTEDELTRLLRDVPPAARARRDADLRRRDPARRRRAERRLGAAALRRQARLPDRGPDRAGEDQRVALSQDPQHARHRAIHAKRSSCGSSPTPDLPPSGSRATWSTIRRA